MACASGAQVRYAPRWRVARRRLRVCATWRRLEDGTRIGDRALRFAKSARELPHAAHADWLPPPHAVSLLKSPHSEVTRETLKGVDNEPLPHHHDVPRLGHARDVSLVPPPLRSLLVIPQTMAAAVRPALTPYTLAGPLPVGTVTAGIFLLLLTVMLAGWQKAKRDDEPGEAPLFRLRKWSGLR